MKAYIYPDNDKSRVAREVDVEISTASLIAELEKRRPCGKCKHGPKPLECEEICCWGVTIVDAFKPAK